ncbi:MAG: hypothetical protein ACKO2P_09955 [Planctomycetota bacterium]
MKSRSSRCRWLVQMTAVLVLVSVSTPLPAQLQLWKKDKKGNVFCPPPGRASLDNPCPPGMKPVPKPPVPPDPNKPSADPNEPADPNRPADPDRPGNDPAPNNNNNAPNPNPPRPVNPPDAPPQQLLNDFQGDNPQATALATATVDQASDFLGFFNTSTFTANTPFFNPQLVSLGGTNLSGFVRTEDTANNGFRVFIPAGSASFGRATAIDLDLFFTNDAIDPNTGNLDISQLSPAQQEELLSFLSRESSFTANRVGAITAADLALLRAARTGSPGTDQADLSLTGGTFNPGGFGFGQALVLPRTGVVISRFKAAEQSNPIPRDRILLGYGWFKDAPGPGGPQDIHRWVPGFEKTFADGEASVEVRMPMAYTFDSAQALSGAGEVIGSTNYELGNLNVSLKQLLLATDRFGFSAGLAVELPTADDLTFSNVAYEVTRVSESVHLSPFTGFLWTPTDRLFFQAMSQVSVDTNGELVYVDERFTGGRAAGRLQDPTTLYVDMQAGTWLYRNLNTRRASEVSGLAGILEIHFNQTLQGTDALDFSASGVGGQGSIAGAPLVFGTAGSQLGVANLTSGLTTEFGQQSRLTCAYVVPLTRTDRQFDSELQVQFAYYFDRQGSPFRVPRARAR